MFRRCHRLGLYVVPTENCQVLCHVLSGWAVNVSRCQQRIFFHETVELIDSVVFSQLVVCFEACLEKLFKQLKLL